MDGLPQKSLTGTLDPARHMAGNPDEIDGELAPNITPYVKTGIGEWSEDDIVTLLRSRFLPDFDNVQGLMALVIEGVPEGGYKDMTDADARALCPPSVGQARGSGSAPVSGIASRAINDCQGFKRLNNEVSRLLDLVVGSETTETETDRRLCLCLTETEGAEDMGRLGDARGTSRAGGRGKPWLKRAENILSTETVKP